jgi:catalase
VRAHPLQWRLVLRSGGREIPPTTPRSRGPPTARRSKAGTLTIDRIESEDTSPCRTINYDPLVLPDGIAPSDDPLLSARSAAYSVSFTRRVGETATPSAVSPSEVSK